MATKKDHPSTRTPSACEVFYVDQSPVNAIELAIQDHRAYCTGGIGQTDFVRQLRRAQDILRDMEGRGNRGVTDTIQKALIAGLCVTQLNLPKGVTADWPDGTDSRENGPDFAEIERLLGAALRLVQFR